MHLFTKGSQPVGFIFIPGLCQTLRMCSSSSGHTAWALDSNLTPDLPQATWEIVDKFCPLSKPSFLINKIDMPELTLRIAGRMKASGTEWSVKCGALASCYLKEEEIKSTCESHTKGGHRFLVFLFVFVLNHCPRVFSFLYEWRSPSRLLSTPKEAQLSLWLFVDALAWAFLRDSSQHHCQTFLSSNQPVVHTLRCSVHSVFYIGSLIVTLQGGIMDSE